MLSKDARQQKCWPVYDIYAVVHILRIAAFFISTKKDISQHQPSDLSKYTYTGALDNFEVRLFLHPVMECRNGCLRCRSPPSDFDFAQQLKIEIGGST